MIIKEYLQIIRKRWWLILLPVLAVVGGAYYWTSKQVPIYESHASFVIRPRTDASGTGDFIKALDTVSNRSEINSTFAEVASSKMIKSLAIERLQLPTAQRKHGRPGRPSPPAALGRRWPVCDRWRDHPVLAICLAATR